MRFTTEEFCKAAERHGLKVNFGVAKTPSGAMGPEVSWRSLGWCSRAGAQRQVERWALRCSFLAQLRTASPMLRALMQEGSMRLPWTKAVVGDLVALQAAQRKVAMMPHPAGDVDAWIKLGVENKSSWKQMVKPVLIHIGSPALGTAEMVQCPDCHKSFLVKGLGHGCTTVFRVARTVVDRSGICPVCGLFHTRQRVIHHIEHSCESCKAAVQVGLVQTLPKAQMKKLDAAKERREARKQGVSYLALRGEDEVVAASYRCLSVHAVRCGGAPFSSDVFCAFLGIAFGLFRAGSNAFVCC